MKKYLLIICLFTFQTGICQDGPFNDYKFISLKHGESINNIDSIEALIYHFSGNEYDNFINSINSNPQLKEIQLNNPPESAVQFILNSERLIDLNTLFIFGYDDDSLIVTPKMGLKHIWVYSEMIKSFQITGDSLYNIEQLQISMPELTDLKINEEFNKLEYLELIAPKLSSFPIYKMKNVSWLTVYCSFNQVPTVFCQLEKLQLLTYSNYKEIELPKCFMKRIKKTPYYDVEIKSSKDGEIIYEKKSKK
jgi:hypothetical protein